MEPIIHALIPTLFLLALFPNLEKKYVFLLFPLAWIIDLDSYFGLHRFYLHNLFFILIVVIILYFIWNLKASMVALYYGLSHLILDLAFPGVALFFPFVQKSYFIITAINMKPFSFFFHMGSLNMDEYISFFNTITRAQYFGEMSLIFLVLAAILIIFKFRYNILKFFKR